MRQIFRNLRQNKQPALPDLDFSSQLNDGLPPFVAILLQYVVVPIGLYFGGGVVVVTGSLLVGEDVAAVLFGIPFLLLFLLFTLANFAMFPEVLRRSFAEGDFFPLLKLKSCLSSIRKARGPYGLAVLGTFILSLIAPMGMLLFFFGVLLTGPFAAACLANYVAQYDELIE